MTELDLIMEFVTSDVFIDMLPGVIGGVAAVIAAPSLIGKITAGLKLTAKIRNIRSKIKQRKQNGKNDSSNSNG